MVSAQGNTELSGYDPSGRLTTLIQTNAAGQPIATIVSSYDAVGRKVGDFVNGALGSYLYDGNSRPIGQEKPGQYATYVYDATDNQTVKWHQGQFPQTSTFDSDNRTHASQLGSVITTHGWDRVGNRTNLNVGGALTTMAYDPENRLISIKQQLGVFSTYTYQGYDGLRRTNQEFGQPVYTTIWDNKANYLGEIQ